MSGLLSVADLTGDAFVADRRGHEVFGDDIKSSTYILPLQSDASLPESKCNTVSLVKAEYSRHEFRTMLAVSDHYICYAVRRSLLRIINTVSSEKTLLRGHKSIVTDMKFNVVGSDSFLCSVDAGSDENSGTGSHTFVWKLEPGTKELTSTMVAEYPLLASVVQPHPVHSNLWAIGGIDAEKNGAIGIISSTDNNGGRAVTDYSSLPMHYKLEQDVVLDLAFSVDGAVLVAIAQRIQAPNEVKLMMWKVNYLPGATTTYDEANLALCWQQALPNGIAVRCGSAGIVTASLVSPTEQGTASVLLQCWPIITNQFGVSVSTSARATQALTVQLPLTERGLVMDAAVNQTKYPNPATETFARLQVALVPVGHFMMLAHRLSSQVACLTVNPHVPSGNHEHTRRLPIAHVALINLKTAVDSIDCTEISGRDHHSEDEVKHLEIACRQDHSDNAQCAVQQHHIPVACLSHPMTLYSRDVLQSLVLSPSAPAIGGATISLSGLSASLSTSSNSERRIDLMQLLSPSAQPALAADSLQKSSSLPSAKPASLLQPPTQYSAAVPSSVDTLAALLGRTPTTTVSDPVVGLDAFGLPQSPAVSGGSVSLLSMIKSNKQKANPIPSEPFVPSQAPTRAEEPQQQQPDFPKPPSTPAGPPAEPRQSDLVNTTPVAPLPLGRSILNMLKPASSSVQENTGVQSSATSVMLPIAPALSQPSATPTESVRTAPILKSEAAPVPISSFTKDSVDSLADSLAGKITDIIRSLLQVASADISTSTSSLISSQLPSSLASILKSDVKKAIDKTLTSSTMTSEIADSIGDKLAVKIGDLLKDSAGVYVREALRADIVEAFKATFESTLIPAFQAGADRMFTHIQSTFANGVKVLTETNSRNDASLAAVNAEILAELRLLRGTVNQLESQVSQLSLQQAQLQVQLKESLEANARLASAARESQPVTQPAADPVSLFRQGFVSDAVVAALEQKDVAVLVNLLALFSGPSQLTSSCSEFIQLCAIQQLAADFSSNPPIEGISLRLAWLKSLVMNFINKPSAPGDNEKSAQLKSVMGAILGFLQQAVARLVSLAQAAAASVDTGDEDDSRVVVSSTDLTDLQMLVAIMEIKFK